MNPDILRAAVMTDRHQHHSERITLGGMRCTRIRADETEVGDFLYHYSDQLDAFHLYEVVRIEGGTVIVKSIDCDSAEVDYPNAEHREPRAEGYNKFYRADADDRRIAERDGFASDNMPLFASFARPNQRRYLNVRLYHRTTMERVVEFLQSMWS